MASSLSDEEFQRMQTQLIQLKEENYTLGDKNCKIQNELLQNNQLLDDLRKELSKSQKIISRSKIAKEFETLIQENEALQIKLQMQEDEFRLQNETIMQELSSLVALNENLKKEIELNKAEHLCSSAFEVQDEQIQLEAENAALKKILSDLENQKNGSGDESTKINVDLELKLQTTLEEKALLKSNYKKLQIEYREQLLNLQNGNDKLSEKLKKKQESFLNLQEEKEQLYSDNKNSFELLKHLKETEIRDLKEQIQSMQVELRNALQVNEQFTVRDYEGNKDTEATVEFIAGEKATFECSLNETKLSLINFQEKMQLLNNQLQESESKMRDLEKINDELQLKVQDLEKQKNELEESLVEKSKLAEKRKHLMDEMYKHMLETTNKHSTEIENLTQQLSNEQEALQKLFDKEKETKLNLVKSRNEVQTLKGELERLRSAKGGTDSKLKEVEMNLQNAKLEYENMVLQKEKEHNDAIEKVKVESQILLDDLKIQVEVARAEKVEFEDKVKALEQEAKDSVDERKIQEKKGLSMVKDLKRQLQVERNRAEKLQERLQEILSEQNRNIEEILQPSSTFDKPKGDASSISSWSYVSGGTADRENRECNVQSDNSSGGHDSPNRISPTLLETETHNLLAKVAQLQQKNWTLEEKVNHLEMSNEALVDDVLKKTALIQFYCMEGRSDPHASIVQDKLTIKRIVDFIKDKGDENMREINRRMQRMLEETLTKNMHLQKDIEMLSNEVSRLSKIVNAPLENGIQSAVFVDGV